MSTVLERRTDTWPQRLSDWFDVPDLARWFDRVGRFDEFIRIEESMHDGQFEVRAELPGIDPERDVDISIADGLLTLRAERKEDSSVEAAGRRRSEFRYGSYTRTVPVPDEVRPADIRATYKDGILTVVVPMPAKPESQAVKVPVTRG
jgi:HSP20 family protein